jgi:hypothetical protein
MPWLWILLDHYQQVMCGSGTFFGLSLCVLFFVGTPRQMRDVGATNPNLKMKALKMKPQSLQQLFSLLLLTSE